MNQSYDRLTASTITATDELVVQSGANMYLGGKAQENAMPASVSIALAASATTDGMDITITVLDADGVRIPRMHDIRVWISESAIGAGLTGDSYSGTVTASVGTILTAITAKKEFTMVTAASGIAVLTAVASANPTDQYVAVSINGRVYVSGASGTNWEGAEMEWVSIMAATPPEYVWLWVADDLFTWPTMYCDGKFRTESGAPVLAWAVAKVRK